LTEIKQLTSGEQLLAHLTQRHYFYANLSVHS
jgi:hypothetical protein